MECCGCDIDRPQCATEAAHGFRSVGTMNNTSPMIHLHMVFRRMSATHPKENLLFFVFGHYTATVPYKFWLLRPARGAAFASLRGFWLRPRCFDLMPYSN
jgi:hypothetical protein